MIPRLVNRVEVHRFADAVSARKHILRTARKYMKLAEERECLRGASGTMCGLRVFECSRRTDR